MIVEFGKKSYCEGGAHVHVPVVVDGKEEVFSFHMEEITTPLSPDEMKLFLHLTLRLQHSESKEDLSALDNTVLYSRMVKTL